MVNGQCLGSCIHEPAFRVFCNMSSRLDGWTSEIPEPEAVEFYRMIFEKSSKGGDLLSFTGEVQ